MLGMPRSSTDFLDLQNLPAHHMANSRQNPSGTQELIPVTRLDRSYVPEGQSEAFYQMHCVDGITPPDRAIGGVSD